MLLAITVEEALVGLWAIGFMCALDREFFHVMKLRFRRKR